MKVQLYENQVNRTDETGARPMTAQINTGIFAQLGAAATGIGKAVFDMGANKVRADNASKKLDAENLATATLLSLTDEVETFINTQENNDPTVAHTAVPDGINRIFQNKVKSLDGNKLAQQRFGILGLDYSIKRKHKFLDVNIVKKIELGKANLDIRIGQDVSIAGDAGADINDRIQEGKNALAEINIAKEALLIDEVTANNKVAQLNYDIAKGSLDSMMNATDDAYAIAEDVEDNTYEDLMFNKYYLKLNPEQKRKIVTFANNKAKKVEDLKKIQSEKILKEETQKIKVLKKEAYNSNDIEEKTRIYNLLIEMNGFDSEKEKDDYEKEINIGSDGTTNVMSYAEKDDPVFVSEFNTTLDTTMSRSILLENKNRLTEVTYEKYRGLLTTELSRSGAFGLKRIKVLMQQTEVADKIFEPSILSKLTAMAEPYIDEYYQFLETNPSDDQLKNKIQTIRKEYLQDKIATFDDVFKQEIINTQKRLNTNKFIKDGFKIDKNAPIESLTKLLQDVAPQNNTTLNTKIKNYIDIFKSLKMVSEIN